MKQYWYTLLLIGLICPSLQAENDHLSYVTTRAVISAAWNTLLLVIAYRSFSAAKIFDVRATKELEGSTVKLLCDDRASSYRMTGCWFGLGGAVGLWQAYADYCRDKQAEEQLKELLKKRDKKQLAKFTVASNSLS